MTMDDITAINEQIADAVRAMDSASFNALGDYSSALARQALTQAVVMAMQNAVAAQQRHYVLRQALTTALARQVLEAAPEEVMKIVAPHLAGDDIAATLGQLRGLLSEIDTQDKSAAPKSNV
jgi:hypothetical protein